MAEYEDARTHIYRTTPQGECLVGAVDDATLTVLHFSAARPQTLGRIARDGRVLRRRLHDEQEVGHIAADGSIHSAGLLQGGALGWLDADGVVMQGGLILEETEVGRVDGAQAQPAAAALLLLLLPAESEADRQSRRQA